MANRDRQVKAIKDQIGDLNDQLSKIAEQNLDVTEGEAEEKYEVMRREIREKLAKMKEIGKKTGDYITENPWQAIGVALALGFLLGKSARYKR